MPSVKSDIIPTNFGMKLLHTVVFDVYSMQSCKIKVAVRVTASQQLNKTHENRDACLKR